MGLAWMLLHFHFFNSVVFFSIKKKMTLNTAERLSSVDDIVPLDSGVALASCVKHCSA